MAVQYRSRGGRSVVEAMLLDGKAADIHDTIRWADSNTPGAFGEAGAGVTIDSTGQVYILTPEGKVHVPIGYYIAKDAAGDLHCSEPSAFHAAYEAA